MKAMEPQCLHIAWFLGEGTLNRFAEAETFLDLPPRQGVQLPPRPESATKLFVKVHVIGKSACICASRNTCLSLGCSAEG